MPIPSSRTKEVQEILTSIGLSEAEQKAYLALLELGQAQASPIAKRIGLPLTTCQSILKRLQAKGLAKAHKRLSRSVYEAAEPQTIKTILEQTMREVNGVIPLLASLRKDSYKPAKIQIYDPKRLADLFNQAVNARDKQVYEIVSAKDFQEVLGERFHFTQRRLAAGTHLKSLRVETREIKKYNTAIHAKELREAKFLPREFTFRCSILFWDTTVAFFTTEREGVVWSVESKELALMMRQLFDMLWSVSRKMETV